MADGRILQNLGAGKYLVGILYDDRIINARLEEVGQKIAADEERLSHLQSQLYEKALDLQTALGAINDAIAVYREAQAEDRPEIKKLIDIRTRDSASLRAAIDSIESEMGFLRLSIASAQAEKRRLSNIGPRYENREVWCADFTNDMNPDDTHQLIEIAGDSNHIMLAPGNRAEQSALEPGRILPFAGMGVAQALYNWALRPGWKKWMPRYRTGKIFAWEKAGDDQPDQITVKIDEALDVNGYSTNQTSGQLAVSYMDCNQDAFQIGDHVVIEFPGQNWDLGVIVGFVDHPRPCPWYEHFLLQIGDTVGAYCPATGYTILAPTVKDSAAHTKWLERARENVSVENLASVDASFNIPVRDRSKENIEYENCVTHTKCGFGMSCWRSLHQDLTLPLPGPSTEDFYHFQVDYRVHGDMYWPGYKSGDDPGLGTGLPVPFRLITSNGSAICCGVDYQGDEVRHQYDLYVNTGTDEEPLWELDSGFLDFDWNMDYSIFAWDKTVKFEASEDTHWDREDGTINYADNVRHFVVTGPMFLGSVVGEYAGVAFIAMEYMSYTYNLVTGASAWADRGLYVAARSVCVDLDIGESLDDVDWSSGSTDNDLCSFFESVWEAERTRRGLNDTEWLPLFDIDRFSNIIKWINPPGETYPPAG